jgi:hypothetical protein
VETIAKIRRGLRVSRKVVRKIVRSDATKFRYECSTQPLPKIGPWRDRLDCLLLTNEDKPASERLTLVRLFEELRGFGYGGSYDAVRRYAISWRKERGAARVFQKIDTARSSKDDPYAWACRDNRSTVEFEERATKPWSSF